MDQLARLIAQGRTLRDQLMDPAAPAAPGAVGVWQRDCQAVVSELSGGVKAHWLSRAYSEALLVPRQARDERAGEPLILSLSKDEFVDVPVIDIVERIVAVLERAEAAIAQAGGLVSIPEGHAPEARRFDFVHDTALRPVLEQAFNDGREALEQGRHEEVLLTSASILESIISDALTRRGQDVASWSFPARIEAAESGGLIRGGCARLPEIARRYREVTDADGRLRGDVVVTARDARTTHQVLRVVMRDLDPGR